MHWTLIVLASSRRDLYKSLYETELRCSETMKVFYGVTYTINSDLLLAHKSTGLRWKT